MMANVTQQGEPVAKPAQSQRKRRILVVDDERDIADSIKVILQKRGYWVETSDAVRAYSSYRPNFYDLIILDYRMPNMDGFALFEQIKRINSRQKICFITAYEGLEKRFMHLKWEQRANSVFDDNVTVPLLKKPFDTATLLSMVSGILGE